MYCDYAKKKLSFGAYITKTYQQNDLSEVLKHTEGKSPGEVRKLDRLSRGKLLKLGGS